MHTYPKITIGIKQVGETRTPGQFVLHNGTVPKPKLQVVQPAPRVRTPGLFYRYVGYDFSMNTNNIATSTSNLITALQLCESLIDCQSFVREIITKNHWFKAARTPSQVPNPSEGMTLYSKIDFKMPGVVPEIVIIDEL